MNSTNIPISRNDFNNNLLQANKFGRFIPPLSILKQFGVDENNITETDLDKIFDVYKASAFDDINAANVAYPLSKINYDEIINQGGQDVADTLRRAIIMLISEYLTNGLTEITRQSQSSAGNFSQVIDTNTRITTLDQINQDVEDELNKIQYFQWSFDYIDGIYTLKIGNYDVVNATFENGIKTRAITFKTSGDMTIISEDVTKTLISQEVTKNRSFRGTWPAQSTTEANNITQIFLLFGLKLTNSIILNISNTNVGDSILVAVSGFLSEEYQYDGQLWQNITNRNIQEDRFGSIETDITNLESTKANISQLPDVAGFETTTNHNSDISSLQTQITTEHNTNVAQDAKIAAGQAAANDYWANKGQFVRASDLQGILISFPFSPALTFKVAVAADVTADAAANPNVATRIALGDVFASRGSSNLSNFATGIKTTLKIVKNDNLVNFDLTDTFTDNAFSPNRVLGEDITVAFTPTSFVLRGVGTGNKTDLTTNYKATLLEQVKGVQSTTIDQTARGDAAVALQTANIAKSTADANKIYAENIGISEVEIKGGGFISVENFKTLSPNQHYISSERVAEKILDISTLLNDSNYIVNKSATGVISLQKITFATATFVFDDWTTKIVRIIE